MNENPTTSEAEEIGQSANLNTEPPGQQPSGSGMQEKAQEKAHELAGKTREAAGEYGHKAQDQLDKGMDQAAGSMAQAAEKLRAQSAHSEGMPAQAGVKVADGMETAAAYLREHNTEEILGDVEVYVRKHPTTALAGAVAAGFLIGRILR